MKSKSLPSTSSPDSVSLQLTFLPAYLPRVIMATRPTLRNFIVAVVVAWRSLTGLSCFEMSLAKFWIGFLCRLAEFVGASVEYPELARASLGLGDEDGSDGYEVPRYLSRVVWASNLGAVKCGRTTSSFRGSSTP